MEVNRRSPIVARFWDKVDQSGECWVWLGATGGSKNGYGVFVGGFTRYAHRFSFVLANGPIPEGFVIDHVKDRGCTTTLCVNPAHLEAVEQLENVHRGDGHGRETHCPSGHPYAGENLYIETTKGGYSRHCVICRKSRSAAAYRRGERG